MLMDVVVFSYHEIYDALKYAASRYAKQIFINERHLYY